jgi:hypothetical protein
VRPVREPLFENTPQAILARFLLGAVLGLFLGALVLVLLSYWGPWVTVPAVLLLVALGAVPLACGVGGIFGLRFLADMVSHLFEEFFGWW